MTSNKDLPKKIRVCGKDYVINYIVQPKLKNGEKKLATISYRKGCINIMKGIHKDWVAELIIHESLHSMGETFGVKLEEEEVHKLASAIHIFLRDNPQLLKLL